MKTNTDYAKYNNNINRLDRNLKAMQLKDFVYLHITLITIATIGYFAQLYIA